MSAPHESAAGGATTAAPVNARNILREIMGPGLPFVRMTIVDQTRLPVCRQLRALYNSPVFHAPGGASAI